jgi:hypothetical protein
MVTKDARGQPILWLSSPLEPETASITTTADTKSTTIPSISLVSPIAIQQDGQVFNNYGPKPNEELLLSYGFTLPSNPDDVVILRLPASALREKGLEEGKRYLMKRDGEVDKDLLRVMRIILGGKAEVEENDADEEEEDEHEMHEKEQRELELELDVLGMLGQMLEDKLGKLEEGGMVQVEGVREIVREMCGTYRQGKR